MDATSGYLRTPTISGDTVGFVTEDDCWTVPAAGGEARRLTASVSTIYRPSLSPSGTWMAFTGRDEHHPEVYVMPARGGPSRRLTWFGATSMVRGWTPDDRIVFATDHGRAFAGDMVLATVAPEGGDHRLLPWGPATEISWGPSGGVVLGRLTGDPARWKRYRGGAAGKLWVDARGNGAWKPLLGSLDTNLANPMWIGSRIWFVSDHEGIANIYSVRPNGQDLRRHTDHDSYYARHATTDGTRIVYAHGADIWLLDPSSGDHAPIAIELLSPRVQRQRKFVPAAAALADASLHPEGHTVVVEARGQVFAMGLWAGATRRLGGPRGARHRMARFLGDGSRIVCVSNEAGIDAIEVHPSGVSVRSAESGSDGAAAEVAATPPSGNVAFSLPRGRGRTPLRGRLAPRGDGKRLEKLDLGCIVELVPAPVGHLVAVATHRWDLVLVDFDAARATVIDHSSHAGLDGLSWSPDGRWLAYSITTTPQTCAIRLYDAVEATTTQITPDEFRDFGPSWDPDGRHLYFLSNRVFNPVDDALYFDMGFPKATLPYLVTLRADAPSPFIPEPTGPGGAPEKGGAAKSGAAESGAAESANADGNGNVAGAGPAPAGPSGAIPKPPHVRIDLDGISARILPFPVPENRYLAVAGLRGKVLLLSAAIEGGLANPSVRPDARPHGALEVFDFAEQRHEPLIGGVRGIDVSRDGSTLLYDGGGRLRVVRAGEKPPDGVESEPPGRRSGWIDLDRIRISVDPGSEWRQMYSEAWALQREHFWTEDLSGVDWTVVHDRYLPLVERVATRLEFSDLMWEMQGELGTSHAYEAGGDYRPAPAYAMGYLGADFAWDGDAGAWRVDRIVEGDPWDPQASSPLGGPGIAVRPGDAIVSINGEPVPDSGGPAALMVHQAGMLTELTVRHAVTGTTTTFTVRALGDERRLRYREWVLKNRKAVARATDGRVGYLHIPDMGADGFAEFHRAFLSEVSHDALIVDVRFNGGGNVSQLVLEKLARRRIGYDASRSSLPAPYPTDSPTGPLVAITNERAGSDGDIFTHCFRLMGLGPMVGKRTWGGVVGIWPRHALADGGMTTQPEFSFWFTDVGWGIENRGAEPDHDVDIRPQDYAAGVDPQLDRAIALAQRALRGWHPVRPDLTTRPVLSLPTLPPREPQSRRSTKRSS